MEKQDSNKNKIKISRRKFLRTTSLSVIATGMGSVLVACGEEATPPPVATRAAQIVPGVNNTPTAAPIRTTPALPPGVLANPKIGTPQPSPATPTNKPLPEGLPPTQTPQPKPANNLPTTNPNETAALFLKNWEDKRYADMYGLLSTNAQSFITQEKFVERYTNIALEATLTRVQARIFSSSALPNAQQPFEVGFRATFDTNRVGQFTQDNKLMLVAQQGQWKIDWTPAQIFKELDNTTYLVRLIRNASTRGEVRDRNNQPLTEFAKFYEVYVVPGEIDNEELVLTTLSGIVGLSKEKIKDLYKNGQPDWRMPIKNIAGNTTAEVLTQLRQTKGVGVEDENRRSYPQGKNAAHIVGYINSVTQDDLKTLAAKGYTDEDIVGQTGIEAWAEDYLAGGLGGKLTVIRRDGATVATMAQRDVAQSASLILTIDMELQRKAEAALGGRNGSVVVMNVNDGAITAMASSPSYDPNVFITGLSFEEFNKLNNDPKRPFQNRAANGQLPIGSVFKAFTTAAILEKGGMSMTDKFTCSGRWTGLGEKFAKSCYIKTGHGQLTLADGLAKSCDIVYYELGKKLDELDSNFLPDMVKSFGMGKTTGLIGLYDSPGQVPSPQWKQDKLNEPWVRGDAVNLGIGQGYFLASPLQVVVAYAALANGGDILVPRLIERTETSNPALNKTFGRQVRSRVAVNGNNLNEIRKALLNVTQTQGGTAYGAFVGAKVKVAGKTGTAESGVEEPHAWFACFAPAEAPKYAVVVCLENGGFGNEQAAPIARKIIDAITF